MTTGEWLSFGVGAAGVVLAVASLTWQAVTFALTGSKVKAHLKVGLMTMVGSQSNAITKQVGKDWLNYLAALTGTRAGQPILELEASNIGRMAVGMEQVTVVTDIGVNVSTPDWRVNWSRGTTLDGHHRASWYAPLDRVQLVVDAAPALDPANNRPVKCWMELVLGNGKTVRTRESIVLTPSRQGIESSTALNMPLYDAESD